MTDGADDHHQVPPDARPNDAAWRGLPQDRDIFRWLCVALAKATSGWPVHLTPDEQAEALDVTFAAADDGGVDITVLAGAEAEANVDVDEPDPDGSEVDSEEARS